MATPTFTTLQQRYLDLIGDSDGTIDAFGNSNINSAIQDILNKYQFSWNVKTDDITLAAGVATLPSDFNPLWNISDARIVASSDNDDNIFTQIRPEDRDSYTSDDYVFWITYDTATDTYIFNSKTLTGTVTIYYNFSPSDLSSGTDVCIIPDVEATSYLAASKNWVGAERDTDLKKDYEDEADKFIQAMWVRDLQNGPISPVGSIASYNL